MARVDRGAHGQAGGINRQNEGEACAGGDVGHPLGALRPDVGDGGARAEGRAHDGQGVPEGVDAAIDRALPGDARGGARGVDGVDQVRIDAEDLALRIGALEVGEVRRARLLHARAVGHQVEPPRVVRNGERLPGRLRPQVLAQVVAGPLAHEGHGAKLRDARAPPERLGHLVHEPLFERRRGAGGKHQRQRTRGEGQQAEAGSHHVVHSGGTPTYEPSSAETELHPSSLSVRITSVRRMSMALATPASPAAPSPYA